MLLGIDLLGNGSPLIINQERDLELPISRNIVKNTTESKYVVETSLLSLLEALLVDAIPRDAIDEK